MVGAGSSFPCFVPRPEDLMFDSERGGAARELSVEALVRSGERLALEASFAKRRYEPELMDYRLGDCIKLKKKCGSDSDWGRETLAAAYARRANRSHDFDLAARLVDEYRLRRFVPKPPTEALVVHLRLGDVVRGSELPASVLLVCSGPAVKNHTVVKSVYELLADAKRANTSRVILVGGSHTPLEPDDPSWFYALATHYAFQLAGYDASLRLETNPDDDFAFMSFANKFDVGCGGYSRIIAMHVEQRGGTIVGRRF